MNEEDKHRYINILTTNRNAVIVIDSDRKRTNGRLNDTKVRIRDEFIKNKMPCWITKGKEIENYLSVDAISKAFGKVRKKQCGQFEAFSDYIKSSSSLYNSSKVGFANKMIEHMEADNVEVLDIKEQILKLAKYIEKWNEGII